MKYVIVLPDGATDEKLPQLGGKTPLAAARTPNMDWVASQGQLGRSVTVPEGFTPGTDVGTLSVFGYDPHRYYSGRAPIEAAAKGIQARPDQMIFRCNFVNITDGKMTDFTAGHIDQPDANGLIAALQEAMKGEGCEFHAGVSYRNLMLLSDAASMKLKCQPPHDIPDQPVAGYWPKGSGEERVAKLMKQAAQILKDHPINQKRVAEGHLPATNIWLWGQGQPVPFETFQQKYGLTGACITAVDILRGMARLLGFELIEVKGATGYIDTDYDAKGRAAVAALDRHDLVVVHVEAADEAGHLGDAKEKVKALERIDEAVVGPLLKKLQSYPQWRILVAPDHPTPASTKAHSSVPPNFAFAGTGIPINGKGARRFTEDDADATGLWFKQGHEMMAAFLKR
ncbi:MAG: cofactor-independent phosphoglycerate mutase [Deltaproteobacteria bacterium]|nr:cofactor-independent phosphoglycerate mutase [Deltaproteobacteria bacterium]